MEINKLKDKIQQDILESIRKNLGWGMIVAATGVGKSRIPIMYSRELKSFNKNLKILIVVPTEKLRDENWKDEFIKWDALDIWKNNVDRACYVSISKFCNQHYDLVVLDEAHNVTENNIMFFKRNWVSKLIGLTATPPQELEKQSLLDKLKLKIIYELPLDKAVELGLVSPYKIIIVGLNMDNKEKYIKAGNKDKPFYTTEVQQYNYLSKTINNLLDKGNFSAYQKMIFVRSNFIYNIKTKTEAARWILHNAIDEKDRILIFAGSIKQAESLNKHYFHSKTNDKSFIAFQNKEINKLACVKSLNEGHNLSEVDKALIVQLDSKKRNAIQRIGRTIRYREGHEALIIILTVKNTVDENWTKSALSGFDPNNIAYTDFEEFKSKYGN